MAQELGQQPAPVRELPQATSTTCDKLLYNLGMQGTTGAYRQSRLLGVAAEGVLHAGEEVEIPVGVVGGSLELLVVVEEVGLSLEAELYTFLATLKSRLMPIRPAMRKMNWRPRCCGERSRRR